MTKFNPFVFLHKLEDAGMAHNQALTLALVVEEMRANARADLPFDAIHAMRRLEASGFTPQQAETLAEGLADVYAERWQARLS